MSRCSSQDSTWLPQPPSGCGNCNQCENLDLHVDISTALAKEHGQGVLNGRSCAHPFSFPPGIVDAAGPLHRYRLDAGVSAVVAVKHETVYCRRGLMSPG